MPILRCLVPALICALAVTAGPALGHETEPHAKHLFGAKRAPAAMPAAAVGSYAKGCLAGGMELAETAPGWQAMRLSRNRNWGHPTLIAFIERLAVKVQAIGWPGLYVGDIAQPRGGPMRSGHRSHQIGLDVDIWQRRPGAGPLNRKQREKISSHSMVTGDGFGTSRAWTPAHHQVLRAAASDPAVARIFVHAAIKQRLCNDEPAGPGRAWLRKIRPWWGHDSHFHVRLRCPPGSADCADQAPPPPGDSCDASLAWWFSDEARNPKPGPKKPRRELTMDDLPLACATVLDK